MIILEKKKAHQRYKNAAGVVVPGASTIAKVAGAYESQGVLMNWACRQGLDGNDIKNVSHEAMNIGTIAHFLTDRYIDKQEYDLSNCAPSDVSKAETACIKFGKWYDDGKFVPIANEEQLVSKSLNFGGTLDNVLQKPVGTYILLDKKTSAGIYKDAFYQLAGLEYLWREHHPDKPISEVGIVRIGKEDDMEDFEVKFVSKWDKYWNVFECGLELYWALKEVK